MKRPTFQGGSNHEERLSTYFDNSVPYSGVTGQDKARLPVRRFELQAILTQMRKADEARRFWPRLGRWLTQPIDWKTAGLPPATERQKMRGEGEPT